MFKCLPENNLGRSHSFLYRWHVVIYGLVVAPCFAAKTQQRPATRENRAVPVGCKQKGASTTAFRVDGGSPHPQVAGFCLLFGVVGSFFFGKALQGFSLVG